MKKILSSLVVALALAPSITNAYHYSIVAQGYLIWDVEVHTVSAFCGNRHPIAKGSPVIGYGEVDGTTGPGCMISKVVFTTTDGSVYTGREVMYPGGNWVMEDLGFGPQVHCYDSDNNDC
jgi:hypothetical protein